MRLTRRRYLLAGSATFTSVSGCISGSDSGGSDQVEDTSTAAGDSEPGEPLTLEFAETAVFTNDEAVELEVTPTEARLTEAIVVGGKGGIDQVSAFTPDADDALYLLVTFRLTNAGSAQTKVPGGLFFTANGKQVSRTIRDVPGRNYDDLSMVEAGETVEGTVVFEVPADAESGLVEAKFRTLFQSPPVRWELDLGDVARQTYDFDGQAPGEPIEFGTEEYRYTFAALGASETTSYAGSDGEERTAAEGSTFVHVEVQSENVGTSPVTLPTAYGMRLLADGSEIKAGQYEGSDDQYTGGKTGPGEGQRGIVEFEVPESTAEYTLQVEFGNGPVGTWELG